MSRTSATGCCDELMLLIPWSERMSKLLIGLPIQFAILSVSGLSTARVLSR